MHEDVGGLLPRSLALDYNDICFFFFSSRRRHTRYIGDWSSDVCSSDLDASKSDPEANREKSRRWHEANPEKAREKNRSWTKANRDAINERVRASRAAKAAALAEAT